MIHLPLLTAALAFAATIFVSSTESPSVARRRAIPWALVALVGTAVGALFGVVPVGEHGVVTAFTPLSAALAVTLSTLVLALIVGTPSAADPADTVGSSAADPADTVGSSAADPADTVGSSAADPAVKEGSSASDPADRRSSERVDAPFFGRLLAMGSIGTAFLLVREPMLLALVWPFTAAPLLAEVQGKARRRVIEHVALASVLALAGTLLATIEAPVVVASGLLLAGVLVREGIAPAHGLVVHAHRDAPIGVALLLTQPQLGLHLLAQLDAAALASSSIPVLALALLTALGAAYSGLRAQTPRALLLHVTLTTTALAIAALTISSLSSDAILLVLVVGTSLGAFGLALAIVDARGISPTLSSATLTLGLVALALPAGLVLLHASKADWAIEPTLLAVGAVIASTGLLVPLARVSTPPTSDPEVRVSWSEGTAMTGLALVTTLLALHADRFATWLG